MSEVSKLTPETVEKRTEELSGEKNIAPDYLRLFSALFTIEYRMEQKLRLKDIYPSISKIEIRRRLDANLPVIDPEKIDISEAALVALLGRTVPVFERYAPGARDSAIKLLAAEKEDKVNLREMVRAIMTHDADYLTDAARMISAEISELTFIGSILARPLLHRLAGFIKNKNIINGTPGDTCPVCGGVPLMARISRDDGRRVLECSLCGTEWTARRIRCLACGNEDDTALGYFYVEDESCRVDKCDKCHSYIKTLDERKKSEFDTKSLRIEDAATLHLDVLAEEKGYHSLR